MEQAEAEVLRRLDALPVWPYRPRVLAIVGAAYFFAFFDIVNIGFCLPSIETAFSINENVAAIAISFGLAAYVIGALSDAFISDRFGRQIALMISVIFFTVGTLISGFATSFPMLLVGRVIAGMGIGADIAAATAYITGISPARLRGQAGSKSVVWGYVGVAVAPFIAMVLLPGHPNGWRIMFIVGGIGGLIILPLRRLIPESPRWLVSHGQPEKAEPLIVAAEEYAKKSTKKPVVVRTRPPTKHMSTGRTVALFLAVWFVYYIGNYGWLTLAPTLLTDNGFSLSDSLSFLCVTGLGLVVGALFAVWVADRFERKFMIAGALCLSAVSFLAIGALPRSAIIMVFGFLICFTIGLVVPLLYVNTSEQFSGDFQARGVANTDGWGHIGAAICPQLILPAAGIAFFWGFAVMAATAIISGGLVLLSRRMTGLTAE